MKVTKEEQHQLLTLADTDEEIRRLEHKRANLEEQKVLESHIDIRERVTDELLEATRTKDNLTVQTTRLEREIEVVDTGRKQAEANIYSGRITNEKELQAIRDEIKAMQRRKHDLEDSLLEAMEQLEEVTGLVDDLTSRRTELAEQITDLTARRDTAATDIDTALAEIRQRRSEEVAQLQDQVVDAYDRLRAVRPGRVVARLEGKTCTGCHMEQTAIDLEEIKEAAATGLAHCPQCNSIIVPS